MKACVETLLGGGSGHSAAGVLFGAENEQSMAVPRHSCGRVRCGTRISKNGTPVRMWKQMAVIAGLRGVRLSGECMHIVIGTMHRKRSSNCAVAANTASGQE